MIDWSYSQNVVFGSTVPIVATGPVVFLDLYLYPQTSLVTGVYLGPATPATIPGRGAINNYFDPGNIVAINFPCPVGDDGWTPEPWPSSASA